MKAFKDDFNFLRIFKFSCYFLCVSSPGVNFISSLKMIWLVSLISNTAFLTLPSTFPKNTQLKNGPSLSLQPKKGIF